MKVKNTLFMLCLACSSVIVLAQDTTSLNERINDARDVMREIMKTPDKSIPNSIARQATCVGVIPSVKKAAFIIGASYGQ